MHIVKKKRCFREFNNLKDQKYQYVFKNFVVYLRTIKKKRV